MEQKINGKIENYYYSKAINRHYTESTIHYHPHYEIYFMKEGNCKYFIDDSSYYMETGDIVFIPKGAIHRANYPEGAHSRLLINCTDEFIPEIVKEKLEGERFVYHSHEIAKHAELILEKIEHEYNNPDEFTIEALKGYTAQLLFLILRYPGDPEKSTTGNELIDDIVKYINENYTSDIKLSTVAKLKSVSPEHLSRTFKACIGNGFNEYVTLLRLKRAEEMIKTEPNKTISEIAYECGFNDGNYFSYKFKKMYGISPTKTRDSK